MKIDFAQTKRALQQLLTERLATFRSEHPEVQIQQITLWLFCMGAIAHVRLATTDDDAVFGGQLGEYHESEYGPGLVLDFWPNFYECAEGELYEFLLPDGSQMTRDPEADGDEAIDRPTFDLLCEILQQADFSQTPATDPLMLKAEIGNGSFEVEWQNGTSPKSIAEREEQVRYILGEPDSLDNDAWLFVEIIDGEPTPMIWTPQTTTERERAARFAAAIAKIDWSDHQVHEVRY